MENGKLIKSDFVVSQATKKQGSVTASTSRPPQTYLPSAQLTFTASKGRNTQRGGKQVLDLAGAIGTNEDIERRIEEQLNRPKAMFAEDGIVSHGSSFVHVAA